MYFEQDIQSALQTLRSGGIILYPTDTIWGIGCDATNEVAVRKIFELKQRPDNKSMIVLLAAERDLLQYISAPDMEVFQYLDTVLKPTTVIYEGAIGLADNLIGPDSSIGIRMVKDEFCRHLIKRLGKPIVSTSANLSGQQSPQSFSEIDQIIRDGVDYQVQWRQEEIIPQQPSSIVKWNKDASVTIIRP
ncbi:MAG: threonylcarbamoyl-AMP synthase [Chitinophagaceae bacterium]|nr:threonylcarbamoyl-AMP synthase [Chitinophagaceae bacterium]